MNTKATNKQSPPEKSNKTLSLPAINKANVCVLIRTLTLSDEICDHLKLRGYSSIVIDSHIQRSDDPVIIDCSALITETSQLGHRLVNELKGANTPVIVLSHEDTIHERLKAVRSGGTYFHPWPIDYSDLNSSLDKATTPRDSRSYKVLIIDDDEMLASYHGMIILRAGMKIKKLTNPLLSLDVIDSFLPDLILMDLYMPSCSGAELARIIRQKEKYSGIPIIFLSTESDLSEQMNAMEFGGDDFLSKPVSPERLVAAVSNRARRATELNLISSNLKVIAAELKTKTIDLDEALTTAQSSEALKDRLLATMSHEIRTPINGILGIMDKLQQSDLDSNQHKLAETVISSTESLLSILNDTLDYSKLEAGMMSLEKIEFSIRKVSEQVLSLFHETASKKGVSLQYKTGTQVPEILYGDPVRVKQVLINLLNNAIKFTDNGSVKIVISTKEEDTDHITILFEVIDSGIGMTPTQLNHIFDEYKQADKSTSRTYGGTGLGLSICKRLATIMGGEVGVTSKKDKGSTFWFTAIFYKKVNQKDHDSSANHSTSSIVDFSNNKLTALIVEDNEVNQMIITSYLQKHGISSTTVNNGEISITEFSSRCYDLIFMDCEMPVLDGYQATQIIRMNEKLLNKNRTPIIAMTGNVLAGDREKCLDAGMDDYLTKPINKDALATLLEKWLE